MMKNKRQTIQKGLVLDTVLSADNHPNAEQIYDSIRGEHPSISRATVYRNLNTLVEDGQVLRIRVPGGPDHFDKTLFPHAHVQCLYCGAIGDVGLDEQVDLLGIVKDPGAFSITSCEIVYNGICPDCQRKLQQNAMKEHEHGTEGIEDRSESGSGLCR